jgi:hypothetical protein
MIRKLTLILLILLYGTFYVGIASSGSILSLYGPIPLPKTGQITFFYPGDDGDLQKGITWPDPRFQIEGDCIQDKLTGLTWSKTVSPFETKNWFQALSYANDLILCDKGDWRLPNILEMETLIHKGEIDQIVWLKSQGFNLGEEFGERTEYWTSTTDSSNTGNIYMVNLGMDGDISTSPKSTSSYSAVLAVRGGQKNIVDMNYPINIWKTGQTLSYAPGDDGDLEMGVSWPSPRFFDNNDGTVTDRLTMLVWLKDANCINSQYPSYNNYFSRVVTWQEAFDFVNGINEGNYSKCSANRSDWRLPNRMEILSLFDFSKSNPSLPSGHPFYNIEDNYWTSTTLLSSTDHAWINTNPYNSNLIFQSGMKSNLKTSNDCHVWPVRGGLSDYLRFSTFLPLLMR